ncbi:MAG TPA: SPFH domain-containing protein [Gaiellaceae bacterium]
MFLYKVAEPNEALIISGMSAHRGSEGDAAGLGFKIVVGKGAFYMPGLQKVRHLSLDIHEAELDLECVTTQGIRVSVKSVVIYKIADDFQSIANAARRFLEQEEQMDVKVHNVFAGHLRSIVGTMTIEDMIRNRDALTKATRESSAIEMQRLGLTIDSLQIQEIEDSHGYIDNLAAPESARVAKDARIAQAAADREATEREQEAEALKVAATAQSQIKQAQAKAEAQQAQSRAEQAGPLAAATAKQEVVVQETKVAQLEAERTEQQLQTEVRKPADAEAYKTRTVAEAARDARISQAEAQAREVELSATADAKRVKLEAEANATRTTQTGDAEASATRAKGLAEGEAVKARGLAEADAIKARADALATNQEAVIGQQIAEQLPQIVAEAAKAFASIGNLTVLNGAEGIGQLFTQVIGMGASAIPMLRGMLDESGEARANGAGAAPPAPPPPPRARATKNET